MIKLTEEQESYAMLGFFIGVYCMETCPHFADVGDKMQNAIFARRLEKLLEDPGFSKYLEGSLKQLKKGQADSAAIELKILNPTVS